MSDSNILLGKRYFLFSREESVAVDGWTFYLPEDYHIIAGGSEDKERMLISLYNGPEKMAQLQLTQGKSLSKIIIEAVSSDVNIEILELQRKVKVIEKY